MIAATLALSLALAAVPVTDGYGWETADGVKYLDRAGWSIQFYDANSRTVLSPYMKLTAIELEKNTGVDFQVTTTLAHTDAACPGLTPTGRHRIIVRLDAGTDRSYTYPCHYASGAASSSSVHFGLDRWNRMTRGGTHTAYRKNVSSHELGHSVGLGHPDEEYVAGVDPLMSGNHWGGYSAMDIAQKYTSYDIKGLKQLVVNRP